MSDPAAVAAAVAAFVAAGVSLVNVGITARLASRSQRETWRRTEERPIVARYLTLSGDAFGEWEKAAVNTAARAPDWESLGEARIADLRYEVAQLGLLAGRDVTRLAHSLYMAHVVEFHRLSSAESGQHNAETKRKSQALIKELERALVEAVRTDLGLGPSLVVPRESLIGRVLARISGQ